MTIQDEAQLPGPVSERQMRLMLDAIPARIWFLDPHHRVRFANREAAELFELDPEAVIGRSARELLGEDGWEQDKPDREKALCGTVAKWEGWSTYPDGEDRYTQRIFNPHIARDGKIDGYYEFVRDITDLKRAEREQNRWAQLINDAIESIPQGFGVFDANEMLQICNRPFSAVYGKDCDDVLGETASDLFVDLRKRIKTVEGRSMADDVEGVEAIFADFRGGRGNPIEVELDDGHWFAISRHPTSEGGFVVLRSDITERKRFEKDLQESEQRFRGIAGIHPVPVIITTPEGAVLYASPAWRDLFKYSTDEIAELEVVDTYSDPQDRSRYLDIIGPEGRVDGFECEFKRSDGSAFWASMTSRRIVFDGREAIVAGIHDLTERRAAEQEILEQREALAQSERRLRTIVESHPVPLVVTDFETSQYIYESPAAAELLGHDWPSEKEYFARDSYVYPERRDEFARLLRENNHVVDYEVLAKRVDGSQFWSSISAQRIDLDGREVMIVSMADLTERKEREEELRQARELLEDAIEALSEGFVLFDSDDRLVTCNKQYLAFNESHQDLLVPGAKWRDITRARGERGLFKDAVGRVEDWLKEEEEKRKSAFRSEIPIAGDRWFNLSNRRTRQGGTVVLWQDITERKRMEEALRESEDLIRRVVEDCPVPILMSRAEDGKILYESPASRKAFGMGPDDDGAYAGERFANPDFRKRYIADLRERGALDAYVIELQRSDGSKFIGAVSARLVKYRGEDAIVATNIDITETRRRERELRQARELLEDAIESLSEGFALYDAEDRLVMCNLRYREQNPMTAELLLPGVKWVDFIREGARRGQYVGALEDAEAFVRDRLEDRRKLRSNLEFQQADGRWFQFSNQRTRQGGIVVTRTDVTERKTMEEALRESEALVRRVLEAHPIPVGMSRVADGQILYASPGLNRLFVRDEEPTGTMNAIEFYVDPGERDIYIERLKSTGAVDGQRVKFKRTDGSEFWASISSRMLSFKGEEVSVFSTIDLTEQLATEDEIERQRKVLYQSEKMSALGSLLAGVAHELNNPLSVVVGQAMMLEEVTDNPRIAERAAKIGKAADRCARIVKTFLAMARDQKPMRSWVNLNEIVDSAFEVVGYSLRQENVDITLDLAQELPVFWGDGDQLNQVVANIALNAQQALRESPGSRALRVATAYDAARGRLRLTIADNGPGIPEDLQTQIFEPFFTTKPVGSGTGIGLAFCQRIVDAHGGVISVDSRPGEGATFTIELSCGTTSESGVDQAARHGDEVADLRILVVDDEPEVADMLSEMLEAMGHRPVAVTSGRAAIEYLADNEADLIISDLRMPDVDGPKLFDRLRASQPEMADRMAFMTGDHLSASAKSFIDESGRPFIEKPVLPGDLRDLIAGLMRVASD